MAVYGLLLGLQACLSTTSRYDCVRISGLCSWHTLMPGLNGLSAHQLPMSGLLLYLLLENHIPSLAMQMPFKERRSPSHCLWLPVKKVLGYRPIPVFQVGLLNGDHAVSNSHSVHVNNGFRRSCVLMLIRIK